MGPDIGGEGEVVKKDIESFRELHSRILITGGAGFIGSHLQEALLREKVVKREKDLIILDTYERNSIKYTDLNPLVFKGDVRDKDLLSKVIVDHKPEVIFNLAAMTGIEKVEADPLNCMDINFNGTRNVCELALEHEVKKIVHFSTSEVYGECHEADEKTPTNLGAVGDTRWGYSSSKVAADHLINAYINQRELNACIVRPFNIMGPRQTGHGCVAHFIVWALDGLPLKIYGLGEQVRSWCVVYDLADAVIEVLRKDFRGVINIGNPYNPVTINQLADIIIRKTNSKSKPRHVPKRPVDIMYRVPNIDLARKTLGWKPKWRFEEALNHTIKWYQRIDYHGEEWRSSFDDR